MRRITKEALNVNPNRTAGWPHSARCGPYCIDNLACRRIYRLRAKLQAPANSIQFPRDPEPRKSKIPYHPPFGTQLQPNMLRVRKKAVYESFN